MRSEAMNPNEELALGMIRLLATLLKASKLQLEDCKLNNRRKWPAVPFLLLCSQRHKSLCHTSYRFEEKPLLHDRVPAAMKAHRSGFIT